MGDIFAPLPQYINDNIPQLHQGMGIENIIWLYAYMFGLVTFVGAVLMIMVARRLVPVDYEESESSPPAQEVPAGDAGDDSDEEPDPGGDSDQDEEDPEK